MNGEKKSFEGPKIKLPTSTDEPPEEYQSKPPLSLEPSVAETFGGSSSLSSGTGIPEDLKYAYLEPWLGAQQWFFQYGKPYFEQYYGPTLGLLREAGLGLLYPQPLERAGTWLLSDILGGRYTSPEAIMSIYGPMADVMRSELEKTLAEIRSRYNVAGTPASSAEALAIGTAAAEAQRRMNELLARLTLEERERQMEALKQALAYTQLPAVRYEMFQKAMAGIPAYIGEWGQLYGGFQPQLLSAWYPAQISVPWWQTLLGGLGSGLGTLGTLWFLKEIMGG